MNPFDINIGHQFAQPYESCYAMLRRCLIVNPGIPLSIIDTYLRTRHPKLKSLDNRLLHLQLKQDWVMQDNRVLETYQRQCPLCAESMYHTDGFLYPWLTQCPIHRQPFTESCPECNLPWPSPKKLAQSKCQICGRLSMNTLRERVIPKLKKMRYDIIGKLYQFSKYQYRGHRLLDGPPGELKNLAGHWWQESLVDNNLFGICQSKTYLQQDEQLLTKLSIQPERVYRRTTPLIPLADVDMAFQTTPQPVNQHRMALSALPRRKLVAQRQVMRYLAAWIMRRTQPTHQVHITNYRHLSLTHFIDGPDPCPYCMALSLWFFHVSAKHCGVQYSKHINNYPFLWEIGCDSFLNIDELLLAFDEKHLFCTSNIFSSWFYRRGLEILYIDLLRSVFNLFEWIERARKSGQRYFYRPPLPPMRTFEAQFCFSTVRDNTFSFYYQHEHPLEVTEIPRESEIASQSQCTAYHHYLADSHDTVVSFEWKLTSKDISPAVYLTLLQIFLDFLISDNYSSGSSNFKLSRYPAIPVAT